MTVLIFRHRMHVDRFSVSFSTWPMSGSLRGKVIAPKRFFRAALIYISLRCMYVFLLVSAIQFLLLNLVSTINTFTVLRQILHLHPTGLEMDDPVIGKCCTVSNSIRCT